MIKISNATFMFYKRVKISQTVTDRKLQANSFMTTVVEYTIKHFYNNILLKYLSFHIRYIRTYKNFKSFLKLFKVEWIFDNSFLPFSYCHLILNNRNIIRIQIIKRVGTFQKASEKKLSDYKSFKTKTRT